MVYVCDPNTRELGQKNHASEDSLGYVERLHMEKMGGAIEQNNRKVK